MEDKLIILLASVEKVEIDLEISENKYLKLKSEINSVPNDSKLIVSMPIYEGKRYPIDLGKRVVITFMKRDSGMYTFKALIVGRTVIDNIPVIHIQRISPITKKQRRDYYRLPLVIDAVLEIPDGIIKEKRINKGKIEEFEEINYKDIKIITNDVSGGGLRAVIYEEIQLGSLVIAVLDLNGSLVRIESKVVRCRLVDDSVSHYDLGLRFTETNDSAKNKLISFIFEKQRKLRKKGMD